MGANRSGIGCFPLTNVDNGGVEPTMVSVTWLLSVHNAFHVSTGMRKHSSKSNILTLILIPKLIHGVGTKNVCYVAALNETVVTIIHTCV
jgi:hypothetical protein